MLMAHSFLHSTPPSCRGRREGGPSIKEARTSDRPHQGRHEHQVACRRRCEGGPIGFFMSAGPVSDYTGAAALLGSLPKADWLLADRGCDADWLREALKDKGMKVCIPGRKSRKTDVRNDKRRYKRRNRIEIMFGPLKDWRRVATRYDCCPETFFSAITLAATVLFWL
ncbi:IS5 family transposase [Cereibacter sphaeroides]|uniref:IS5 family transposase n=1 Tax=Cereibacter sphaeroides TaxID=1063 RepID=UPI002D7EAA29|nr:IS5 family transposase [Cereibacter sphaeroides]MCE6951161.1 IS5 family transposase [Cereibacter sphaeroides]